MSDPYVYTHDQLAALIIAKHFPEKTDAETALLIDYLSHHADEFDRFSFSVRIGEPVEVAPDTLPSVARAIVRSSMKRIDFVGYFGQQATIVEAKKALSHQVLGQLLSDRMIWLQERPDAPEPRLVAIGRSGTAQDVAILNAHGIDAYIYPPSNVR